MDTIVAKTDLRRAARERRAAAFARHGVAAGQAIGARGLSPIEIPACAAVSAFLAIGEEIDPLPLMRRLWADGHEIALPVMIGKALPLVFRRWREGEPLGEVQWGIREPLPNAPEMVPDVMLVPLLAFDRRGFRLGYGGGFYDRSIARVRALKPLVTVGIAYDELEVDAVPHNAYDQPLDWVLTPSGPILCRA
ncbi:MAG: 5-formyltetrahydrofolate cyclo-ligase [Hyphomicrobiaceae bacterium]